METAKTYETGNRVPLFGSSRFALCLMNCVALLFLYLLRFNISMTMVCMVRKPTARVTSSGSSFNFTASPETQHNASFPYEMTGVDYAYNDFTAQPTWLNITGKQSQYGGEFEWSRAFQGHVLSSYFYGYLSTMFLGGWLAGRYGGKHVIGVGLLVSSIATLLIPPAVRLNEYLIILLRVIIGAAAGPSLPSTLSLGGLWYSPSERSFLMSVSRIGITIGSIAAFLLSSQFCEIKVDNGWPIAFYVTGGAGVLFCVLWNVMVYSSPDHHPRINQREKEYIAASTGIKTSISQRSKFPWFKAITSSAVWATIFPHTSNNWFTYTALTSFPLYMRDVLRFNVKENGLFLILPHLLVLATNVPIGHLADYFIRRRILSTVAVRRLIQTFASLTSSVLLVSLSFIDYDNRYIAVGLLTAISPVQTLSRSGYGVSALDFAPRYSGEIYGMSNTFATLSGILAPVVVGYVTTHVSIASVEVSFEATSMTTVVRNAEGAHTLGTKGEWQTVFFIAAGMYAVGAVVFAVFVEGTVLPWADNEVNTTSPMSTTQRATVVEEKCRSAAIVPMTTRDSVPNGYITRHPTSDSHKRTESVVP